ncbi:hemin uptake protein HemP [Duganella qianjiadongensis]|uniref:Hemin uptake protein HemP n=1 Tax=Duganella qianjiadongensis TaxID=2692176 RepID=A0ABW9VH09_9BURK|nr:hemin uptake protein HemP [Duganella qianjiadongensis]MYM38311.1 hemin uptake protein HemP [Duganella qianjiadongensis]
MSHTLPACTLQQAVSAAPQPRACPTTTASNAPRRVSSATLMGDGRSIEIEHGGRIYQLRITQLNKLILTA